ncbi:MAG: holo-ACP synthase [Defluviitaleaceae bacterium]|nr:holo-ACP synthase [Defluviitaleaceae bacterium]MCL2274974.1 holo-ACP synthase [Defluviitaleaceae bacterium]
MARSIGTDIVKIARFAEISPHFIGRVYTKGEQEYLLKKNNPASYAGLFAAKEAVAKALGTGFRGFFPCDIEIWHDTLGKPHVRLHNMAAKTARKISRKRTRILISISHTDTDALAVAILE